MPDAITIEFHGSIADSDLQHSATAGIAELPREPDVIAEEIAKEISKKLPVGIKVEVQIEFRTGSLEWAGLVLILDWMGRISGSIALGEYLVKTIRFSVNRVLRRRIPFPPLVTGSWDTAVRIIEQPMTAPLRMTFPVVLSIVNTVLLIAVLVTLWWRG